MKIASRIKVMARLDVSERRVPQDGRIKLKLSKTKAVDFRVNTCPTLFGEKSVLRILDSSMSIPLEALGYEDFQLKIFMDNIHKPYGMFLVTGPTGSGKTVSLYSGINVLNQPDINISTAEDPVEINLAGVNQVQVDERTGMTFDKALKAFLRQDPDIILVGEIRDLETGNIAIKAAQTGHMVMSTLHTNDAPQTLTRMVDMGIKPFAIASAVNVITAQRLGRRLCNSCKRPIDVPKEALIKEGFSEADVESDLTLFESNPEGCDKCNSGYKGRVGIYQVLPMSEEIKRLVMEGRNAIDIADQAKAEGVPTSGISHQKMQRWLHRPQRNESRDRGVNQWPRLPQSPRATCSFGRARDKSGKALKGEMPGTSDALIKAQLRRQGINPTKVRKKPKPLFGSNSGKAITPKDIAVFSRQMATMMSSGVPLVQSFEIVGRGHENPKMAELILGIKGDVEAGNHLADALAKRPLQFDDLYVNLVRAGEAAGILEDLMNKIATYKEKTEAIKGKIKKALFYPAAVLIMAFVVTRF